MRSFRQPKIIFSRRNKTKELVELRKAVVYTDTIDYKINIGAQLDHLAVKFYGAGKEYLWYNIADANVDILVSRKCDFSNVNSLRIP